jgi:drug/metabolite transporter (DMT)-like permease
MTVTLTDGVGMQRTDEALDQRWKVWLAFAAIYVVWGSTYIGIKVVVQTIPPLTAAGIRFAIAGIVVYGWARMRGASAPRRNEWINIGWIGALMFLPTYAALFWAEQAVPSGISAVLVATLPLWTVLLEAGVIGRRRVTPTLAGALIAGFVGVVMMASGAGAANGHPVPWIRCAAVAASEVFWAIGSIVTTRVKLPKSTAMTAGGEMLCGGLLLLVTGAIVGEWHAVTRPTAGAIGAMAYLIVAGSIVAFSAYVWLLSRASATRLSSFTYVNPLVALAIGYEFGAEHLTANALLGALLVVVSVVLVQFSTRRSTARVDGGYSAPAQLTAPDEATINRRSPTHSHPFNASTRQPQASSPRY